MARTLVAALAALAGLTACDGGLSSTPTKPGTLEEYKLRMRNVLTNPGVVFLDVDEGCTCVVVGILDPSAQAQVRSAAGSAGVPDSAVQTVAAKRMVTFASLRDGLRPIKGGLQIQNKDRAFCTMMATVYSPSRDKKGLLTNSHCTRTRNAVDGMDFFQAGGALFSADFVAREVVDPDSITDPACPDGRACRRSDAVFAEFDTGTVGRVGVLARPSKLCNREVLCDPAMDSVAAELQITGLSGKPATGDTLHKVGRTSGWTRGRVSRTCVDINVADEPVTMLCQHIVEGAAAEGDSGSPVFSLLRDDKVVLAGILWGGPEDNSMFVFSTVDDIAAELGAFDYF